MPALRSGVTGDFGNAFLCFQFRFQSSLNRLFFDFKALMLKTVNTEGILRVALLFGALLRLDHFAPIKEYNYCRYKREQQLPEL